MDIKEQIIRLEKGISYVKMVLAAGGLQEWEIKEYNQLLKRDETELLELQDYINNYLQLFNS